MDAWMVASLLITAMPAADATDEGPWEIPIVLVSFFPVKDGHIDLEVTGDWGEELETTRRKVEEATAEALRSLEEGSRYHAYSNPEAPSSLRYRILARMEFYEPVPTYEDDAFDVPVTDYNAIMKRIDARDWVENRGVKEFWIWGYHGGKVVLWESNMASPHGDVSNSNRDPDDLPVFSRTYTVYHYNYQRSSHEAVHNHFHQLEHLLNHVDGRETTPDEDWDQLLFWGKFVGSDKSHKIVRPGAGWCHYPPNAEQDYDYSNPRTVETDIEDWRPDGTGARKPISSERWDGDDLKFYVYWFQSLPGAGHSLVHEGRPLRNWWIFTGDWDHCMAQRMRLTAEPADGSERP